MFEGKKNQSSNKTVIQIKDFPVETANELEKLEFHHFKNQLKFRAEKYRNFYLYQIRVSIMSISSRTITRSDLKR